MNKYNGSLEPKEKKGLDIFGRSLRKFKFVAISAAIMVFCLIVALIIGVERIKNLNNNLTTNILELIPVIKNYALQLWEDAVRVTSMQTFNNREIAVLIWLGIAVIAMLMSKQIRDSLADCIKILFTKLFITLFMSICIYTFTISLFLSKFQLWDASLLKDTVMWILFSAFISCINFASDTKKVNLKNMIKDNLKIVLIIEFIANAYSFSLLTEVIIFPIILLVVMCSTYVENKPEYNKTKPIFNSLQVLLGTSVLSNGIWGFIVHYKSIGLFDTIKSFILAPLLGIAFIPFIYIFAVMVVYNSIKTRLKMGREKPKGCINYSIRKIFFSLRINLPKLNDFLSKNAVNLMKIQDKEEIKQVLNNYHLH